MRCPSHNYNGGEIVDEKCRRAAQWYHSGCGGKSQIYDDFTLRCSSCYIKNHIKNWKFYCSKYNEYYQMSALSFSDALAALTCAQTDPQLSTQMKLRINQFVGQIYQTYEFGW
ncbi:hypothetical protein ABPG72_006539 [Tetrahymena utriculariae]